MARYPEGRERSAIMPLLYLAQSVEGHVTREGCARSPSCSASRPPRSRRSRPSTRCCGCARPATHLVNVCTNLSCALRGGEGGVRGRPRGGRHPARRRGLGRRAVHRARGGMPRRVRRSRRSCRSTSRTTTGHAGAHARADRAAPRGRGARAGPWAGGESFQARLAHPGGPRAAAARGGASVSRIRAASSPRTGTIPSASALDGYVAARRLRRALRTRSAWRPTI